MTASPTPIAWRVLTGTGTVLGTTLALGAAGSLVWLGTSEIAARAEKLPSDAVPEPVPVVTAPLVVRDAYAVMSRYTGRVEARRRVDLGFEQGGTVAELDVDEGERVAAGDVLARLDTRALAAERAAQVAGRDALRAQAELAQLTADRQKSLLDQNHISRQRFDEARLEVARIEAEIRRAEATIASIDVALDKAVLRAPFDAVLGFRAVDPGARVAGGAPVVELYEDAPAQFRVGLPADIAEGLSEGATLDVEIGGRIHTASVALIRPDIEPATRTRAVILDLPEGVGVSEGALGTVGIAREAAGTGAWVPSAALVEGVRGLWTLYLVKDGHARREAVELIHSDGDRAYVRGAFGGSTAVVAEGPHRISHNQAVSPVK